MTRGERGQPDRLSEESNDEIELTLLDDDTAAATADEDDDKKSFSKDPDIEYDIVLEKEPEPLIVDIKAGPEELETAAATEIIEQLAPDSLLSREEKVTDGEFYPRIQDPSSKNSPTEGIAVAPHLPRDTKYILVDDTVSGGASTAESLSVAPPTTDTDSVSAVVEPVVSVTPTPTDIRGAPENDGFLELSDFDLPALSSTVEELVVAEQLSEKELFASTLQSFLERPELVNESIKKQTGQDTVVDPGDVKRLAKRAKDVIGCVDLFKYTVDSTDCKQSIFTRYFDKLAADPYSDWIVPVIYDEKVVYSDETDLQAAEHQRRATIINRNVQELSDLAKQTANARQRYSTAQVHSIGRSSYRRGISDATGGSATQLSLSFPIRESLGKGCISWPRHMSRILEDRLDVVRISSDTELKDVYDKNQRVQFAIRSASGPVQEPLLDEDGELSSQGDVQVGETIDLVGFVVFPAGQQGLISHEELKKLPVLRGVAPTVPPPYIILTPDPVATLNTVTEDAVKEKLLDRKDIFNLRHVEDLLIPFKERFETSCLAISGIIKAQIAHNVAQYILSPHNDSKRASSTITSASPLEVYLPADKDRVRQSALAVEKIARTQVLDGNLQISLPVLLLRVRRLPDFGATFWYLYAESTNAETANDIKTALNATVKERAILKNKLKSEKKTKAASEDWALESKLFKLLKNPEEYFVAIGPEHTQLRDDKLATYAGFLTELLYERAERKTFGTRLKRDLLHRVQSTARDKKPWRNLVVKLKVRAVDRSEDLKEWDEVAFDAGGNINVETTPAQKEEAAGLGNIKTTQRSLQAIERAFRIMEIKLNFQMQKEDMMKAVLDVSQMYDELESRMAYVRRKLHGASTQEKGQLDRARVQQEFQRYEDEIGQDVADTSTQHRISIILARLLIDLETHRPKHPFKQSFALSGRITVGRAEDRKVLTYSEDTKFKYLVFVASKSADLTKEGQLMRQTQTRYLEEDIRYTALYYDRFKLHLSVKAMMKAAEDFDTRQALVLQEERAAESADTIQIFSTNKSDLVRQLKKYEQYDLSYSALTRAVERSNDFESILRTRDLLQGKRIFLCGLFLKKVLAIVDEPFDEDSSYNPDKWGASSKLPTAPCVYQSTAGASCVSNSFADIANATTDIKKQSTAVKELADLLTVVRNKAILPRRKFYLAAIPVAKDRTVDDKDRSQIYTEVSKVTLQDTKSAGDFDVVAATVALSRELAEILEQSARWGEDLGNSLEGLGTLENMKRGQASQFLSVTKKARFLKKTAASASDNCCWLLRVLNLSLRRHIAVIKRSEGIYSSYFECEGSGPRDQANCLNQVYKGKLVKDTQSYDSESYVEKYTQLSEGLQNFAFNTTADQVDSVSNRVNVHKAHEQLLFILTDELQRLLDHFRARRPPEEQILMAQFINEFTQWCVIQKTVADFTVPLADEELSRARSLRDSAEQSSKKRDWVQNQLYKYLEKPVEEDFADDGATAYEDTDFNAAEAAEFDSYDSEYASNFFEGETEDTT